MHSRLVGERLKKLRNQNNLSQQALADRLGINRSTYSRYESGVIQADYETLQKIADFYGVSVDYLLGRTDDPTPPRKDAAEQQATLGEIDDPELGLWFKELLDAPAERREELRKIWEIIKQREAGRKPGDQQ